MQLIKCVPARCYTSNHSHASYFLFLSHRVCLQEPVVFVSISKSRQETSDCSIHLSERHRIWCVNSEKNNCSVSNCLNKEACLGFSQFPKLNAVADIFYSILNWVNLLKALIKLTWNSYTINTNTACYIMLFNHKVYNERQQVLHRTQLLPTSYNFLQHLTNWTHKFELIHRIHGKSVVFCFLHS